MANTQHQSIADFLNSAKSASFATDNSACESCGSDVEYRPFAFFYLGQSWEVCLPVCANCNPSTPLQTYEA